MKSHNEPRAFPAPAKLNLMLRVVGRRADGYHLLQTVMRFIDYGDTLTFRVREDGAIARVNEVAGVPAGEDLALQAARLLQQAAGTRLWRTGFGRPQLAELALRLGADVPVFVGGENALAEGIGERLTPLTLDPAWYLVLTPPVVVPTARIFAHPELKRDSKPIKITAFSDEQAGNDLEPVVCREYPEVARHLTWLRQAAPAWVTGTGACVFAAFPTEIAARQVWQQAPGDIQGFIAQGLARHPLRQMVK
jgi:4-diphosphocytidyl-2-C-methyl-D-erythritol kinase